MTSDTWNDLMQKLSRHLITNEIVNEITQSSEGSIVVSLKADGASVMSGEFAGVAALLRSEHFHWLIYIHCTAHRLNLMVNDLKILTWPLTS